ncbi:signal recognition particle-docking protein FtsY [Psychromonas algicola]|uniref:signal recognition particle-docking protein FtsY n=1 Tax=Psychromonas algicola TaxID=2555642 RepID=UPI0010673170|nr:signal recognition particle-docking protein FtsY [Psychromonas sp. RZ5]TEW52465.1 signal recognition particle-docking protein FtsY [Psychromonas sp. RZ5]
MSNKKGMFSWFSKKPEQETEEQIEARAQESSDVEEVSAVVNEDLEKAKQLAAYREAEKLAAQAAADLAAEEQATSIKAEEIAVAEEAVEQQTAQETNNNQAVLSSEQKEAEQLGFFARFVQKLKRTRLNFGNGLFSLFKGKKIDDDLFEELEEQLIIADIGVETTTRIIENLVEHADRAQLKDAEVLYDLLKKDLSNILLEVEQPLVIDETKKPYVILMVGVNGVGKTTTIGKLAKKFQNEGKSVMLAAGDTFRAAAVEQLQVWGERNNIPVIAQQTGADSASVLFDAMDAATARGIDVLIADTAGRLQNKDHLMGELAKVVRIMRKKDETAPHEIMLTIDAGTGQNAISQVKLFHEAVGLTGVTFTKLDGTAKGGIIFSIADQFKLPIRYIGVGEGIDDLREFNANEFTEALFSKDNDADQDESNQ